MVNDENKQFSDRQLSFSYWYLGHKLLLKRIFLGVFLVLNLALYLNVFIFLVPYVAGLSKSSDWASSLISQSVDWKKAKQSIRPNEIVTIKTEAIKAGPGNYTVLAWLKNPNKEWYAKELRYKIIFADQKSDELQTFILPGEEKLVYDQNFRTTDSEALTEAIKITILDTDWEMVNESSEYQLPKFVANNITIQNLTEQLTKTRVTANL
ncbi:MAG: hypothetical protein PHH01_02340, partial [Patescibacteria group bacterium]|nr:hypothetical protein [Patescibacteria group bacterium]